MIGSIDPRKNQVTIVGAGIAGLLMGYALKKKGFTVQIFEASERVGGLIRTQKTLYGMSEKAAHSLLMSDEIETFLRELNLDIIPLNAHAHTRFIVRGAKLSRMPLKLKEILQTLIRFFSKPKQAIALPNASLAEWAQAYLGPSALRYLLAPFVTGVFAATPEELNAKISFPKLIPNHPHQSLFQFFRSKKSKSKRPQMRALRAGTQQLVDALSENLKAEIRLHSPIHDIKPYLQDNLVLTTPASQVAKLIEALDPESARALNQVRYSPMVTVTVFYRETDFIKPPRGVGVLIPRDEGYRILGCLFNSSSFVDRAMQNFISLTVMLGGTSDPHALGLSDEEVKILINQELRKLLGAKSSPTHLEIARWPHAIPVYSNELKEAQQKLAAEFCLIPGCVVFNNFSKDVSIRGMIETVLKI